jgi:cytochrome P450
MAHEGSVWKSPEKFVPERFLVDDDNEYSQGDHKRQFFPFGGGHRMCIGSRIAQVESLVFLARFWQKFDLDLEPGFVPKEVHRTTLSSVNGMQVKISNFAS